MLHVVEDSWWILNREISVVLQTVPTAVWSPYRGQSAQSLMPWQLSIPQILRACWDNEMGTERRMQVWDTEQNL